MVLAESGIMTKDHNKGVARHGGTRAGRWPVQLRYQSGLTSDDYVIRQAWRDARLERCPVHGEGGCAFARHGTYARVHPPGTRIPRWYCPQGHRTFSLLPDCLAARLSATLCEVETVVVTAEQAKSVEAAANALRTDAVELPGAVRWTRRRVTVVHAILNILIGLMPERLLGCQPTVASFRRQLGLMWVLIGLRELAAVHLSCLPPPLGFGPRLRRPGAAGRACQQSAGPDPPRPAH
jgi:hypothetical protein